MPAQGKSARAFTLIELLVVIAIILILIAIALPNFLAAQLRAKVTRCRGEIRTLATALEAYETHYNNRYPFPADESGLYPTPGVDPWFDQTLPHVLSTPVAYISNAKLEDPFNHVGEGIVPHYHYSMRDLARLQNQIPLWEEYARTVLAGSPRSPIYFLLSHGPNGEHDPPSDTENPTWRDGMQYNPTNGLDSKGDILYFEGVGFGA